MTWSRITPFSSFSMSFDPNGGSLDAGHPALDDAVAGLPLPRPARPNPLGFVDVRSDASRFTGRGDDGDEDAADPGYRTEVSFRPAREEHEEAETGAHPEAEAEAEAEEFEAVELEAVEFEAVASEDDEFVAVASEDDEFVAVESEAVESDTDESETLELEREAVEQEAFDVLAASHELEDEDEDEPTVETPGEPAFFDEAPEPSESTVETSMMVSQAKPRRSIRLSGPKLQLRRGGGRAGGRVVGLKIGASQIAAAVVVPSGNGHELVELARTPLEPGIVVDGEVRDAEALTTALREFFAKSQLPTRDIRLGLASSRIGVRTLDIVGVDDESRFDNAVRFKAHEVLPVSVNESVLDYRILGERFSESGELMRHIFLVVAPKDQVQPYVEVAREAGLRLAGIDLEALALLRAFVEPKPVGVPAADDRATVVVAIGHEASTLLVAGGGICEFTRVFDWGGSTLQDAIAQELGVHATEAATVLRNLSLTGGGGDFAAADAENRSRALEAVRLRLTPFARELVSSLQFYQTQPDSLGIGEIVITGGTSHLEGLSEALNQMIGVSVRVGDPLSRVVVRRSFDPEIDASIGSMAVPIGLAIDDVAARSVNLLPRDARVQRRRPSLAAAALPVAAAVPALAIGFLFFQANGEVSDRKARLADAQREFAALPVPVRPQIDPALSGEQANRALAVAQVLGTRLAWDAVLRDLSRVLPADVSLTQMSAKVSQPLSSVVPPVAGQPVTTPVTATGVSIAGYTFSHENVAELIARLGTVPSLRNVQLQSSARGAIGKKPVVQFTILADLSEAGGAR
jgi:type IV pilus assembly protein PilM